MPAASELAPAEPQFLAAPWVLKNPNPRAPLVALVRLTTDRPVAVSIEINDGGRRWTVNFAHGAGMGQGLPLVGLRANRQHEIRIAIRDAAGRRVVWPEALRYTTPALPAGPYDFPAITVNAVQRLRLEPGVLFLSVRRNPLGRSAHRTPAQLQFARGWGMLLALDNNGEVVWYYQSDVRMAGIERLANGNIIFHTAEFRTVEIDLLGNEVNSWYAAQRPQGRISGSVPVAVQTLHHQPHEMPNGNFVAMSANAQLVKGYYTSELNESAPRRDAMVMGDTIIEVDRRSGAVLWSWNSFDHLDPFRIGYGAFDSYWHTRGFPDHADWTHGNGVTYDPRDDSVVMSLRLQDAILKVDRKTGEIRWILGTPDGWGPLAGKVLKPVGQPFRWPYHGHNPRVTDAGTIVIFDNGIAQARPFDPPLPVDQTFSRGVEYEIDEAAMTVRQIWASADHPGPDSCLSWAMGDTHRLPRTDNMLVIHAICGRPGKQLNPYYNDYLPMPHIDDYPAYGLVREYTHTTPPEVLFEAKLADPDDVMSWEVYGGFKSASLYPAAGIAATTAAGLP